MKSLFILLLIGASYAYPVIKTWTLRDVNKALGPYPTQTEPEKRPFIEALNKIMAGAFSGRESNIQAVVKSPSGKDVWTRDEMAQYLLKKDQDIDIKEAVQQSFEYLRNLNNKEGAVEQDNIEVWTLAVDISVWTHDDVKVMMKDPKTTEDMMSYLRIADKQFEVANENGEKLDTISIVTPVGVFPPPAGVTPQIVPRTTWHSKDRFIIKRSV